MTPMFLDLLNQANALVNKQYPGAQFYEADQANPASNNWRFVFNVTTTNPNSTALIYYTNGAFSPVEHIPAPWLEDRVIPLPIKMDLMTAEELAAKAGHPGPYMNKTLRWPLAPGVYEPSYILGTKIGFVFVGIYDGKVTTTEVKVAVTKGAYV